MRRGLLAKGVGSPDLSSEDVGWGRGGKNWHNDDNR